MFEPSPTILAAALEHANACAPREGCGAVVAGQFVPIHNRATDYDSFVMDGHDYVTASRQGRIEAIVHSHVDLPPLASVADRAFCEKLGLPWLIVSWPSGDYAVLEPCGAKAPLVGRQWAWGSQDCLAIIRDGLAEYAGITVPDYAREWEFWRKGDDPIGDNIGAAGFVALPNGTPPKHCDVFGMRISAPVVNHLALFLQPDRILHQMAGRLSVRETYFGVWRDLTVLHLRHRKLA